MKPCLHSWMTARNASRKSKNPSVRRNLMNCWMPEPSPEMLSGNRHDLLCRKNSGRNMTPSGSAMRQMQWMNAWEKIRIPSGIMLSGSVWHRRQNVNQKEQFGNKGMITASNDNRRPQICRLLIYIMLLSIIIPLYKNKMCICPLLSFTTSASTSYISRINPGVNNSSGVPSPTICPSCIA